MIKKIKRICEPRTFESIYVEYAKDLRRFIFFKTQDLDEAEDIMQETFIKLWDNCKNVDYGKVKSYLYAVATNLFLNIKKHEKVVRNYQKKFVNVSTSESPEFVFLEKEFLQKIEDTIEALPSKQREVFLLNRMEGKTYKEVSEILGISVKAVEKRMHNALLVMRTEIGKV